MKTIRLRVEDCDNIVIDELKDAYYMNNKDDILEPDYELLNAIKTVLGYYMTQSDYQQWQAQFLFGVNDD